MEHVLTIPRINSLTLRDVEERRRPINACSSRLKDLVVLFMEQFKRMKISLILHQSDWRFQEAYCANLGEYEVKLIVLSYNEKEAVPSVVRNAETVLQINNLKTLLINFSETANFDKHENVYSFAHKCFVICGATTQFQTDNDNGLWTIWFNDSKNRVNASLEITHISLLAPPKFKKGSNPEPA